MREKERRKEWEGDRMKDKVERKKRERMDSM